MAYKLNNRNLPAASTAGVVAVTPQSTPLADALYRYLRAADMPSVARASRACATQATSGDVSQLQAVRLLLAAAAGARAHGNVSDALMWLANANAILPPSGGDLISQLKREEVRVLLDMGQTRAAATMVAQVDCTIIERGKAEPLISRDLEVSVETLLLQAEVALTVGDTDEAAALLTRAQQRMEIAPAVRLTRTAQAEREDGRDYLRLLQAVYLCRSGDGQRGKEMLEVVEGRMEGAQNLNHAIFGRCQAASGTWVEVDDIPPAGISLLEARRWQALSRPARQEGGRAFIEEPNAQMQLSHSVHPPSPVMLAPAMLDVYAHHLRETVTSVTDAVTTQFTERLAAAFSQSNNLPDGYVYGGKFPHIDLASVVVQAEMQRETGYILVNWNVAAVETTIIAGRLSPLARCGVGYVYLLDGTIIDATICAAEPPPSESGDERAALDALSTLLQLGIGVGLDHAPDGQAFCYPDERVRTRHARINIPPGSSQNLMGALVVACETKLGAPPPTDELGEWER